MEDEENSFLLNVVLEDDSDDLMEKKMNRVSMPFDEGSVFSCPLFSYWTILFHNMPRRINR